MATVFHLAYPVKDKDQTREFYRDVLGCAQGREAEHFGAVLEWDDWHDLRDRLIEAETDFVIAPYIRFKGKTGEQATMFFLDPSGNALEFKSFKDPSQIFAV